MTKEEREEAIRCLSVHSSTNGSGLCTDEQHYEAKQTAIKALEQEPILDKIFRMVYPLSIMSTPELEHKAIMQIAEMLEPLCLSESEE